MIELGVMIQGQDGLTRPRWQWLNQDDIDSLEAMANAVLAKLKN
jgi:hypothetical protein